VDEPGHGGNLSHATRRHGEPATGWLDLSTGINPVPFPAPPVPPDTLARLPDRDALVALLSIARAAYALPAAATIAAAPGSEAALRLLPAIAPAGTVAIVAPAYPSHADAWRTAGRVVLAANSIDEIPDEASIAVVGNPNNPDGRISTPERLVALANHLGERGGFLIVDEAFADTAPATSLMAMLDGNLPAVVLRSIGKFYGLAGLRLGFAAGHEAIVGRLASMLGDWPVSGPAIDIARAALSDTGWQTATRQRLKTDMDSLHHIVDRHGLNAIGGTDLFLLIEDGDAGAIHRRLAERGIWTRIFAYEPRWLRLGLPPDNGFDRLDRALAEILPG
jgi:cobalamin biosynthetic protein CobC